MVYTMRIYTDGGCRGNGKPGAIGAAAAVFSLKYGRNDSWSRLLPQSPPPTNQRAEITGIIIALEQALAKRENLETSPRLDVQIYSDSRYAVDCMTTWIYKWTRNGWINSAGDEVANRDLLEEASHLDDDLQEVGCVEYKWIPREQNQGADRLCNERMDEQSRVSSSDSDSDW
ncbi:ribonuclease H-like domain-containing protein [Aspergillus cavernicola]|uniref:Ribonuclease H-like domain-containing protein n=1 Tax=Aspergillus cavernicola TaxID=176166 RepID=A0ABR4IJM3_9EURO